MDALDGSSPADESLELAIDGTTYQWWLTSAHADELRATVEGWIPKLDGRHDRPPVVVRLETTKAVVRPSEADEQAFGAAMKPWFACAQTSRPTVVRLVAGDD